MNELFTEFSNWITIKSRWIKYKFSKRKREDTLKNKSLLDNARKNEDINKDKPLVSVLIPTYNRAEILTRRTIPSILNQTYENIEIIIVGDNCSDETSRMISKIKDDRIIFHNLSERGKYPQNPKDRWMVAGTAPANKAIELASGQWIAPLDDDDEFLKDHIEVLLNFALQNDYEMVYGKVEMEIEPGKWEELGSYPLKFAHISRIAALYQSKLRFFKYDINAWKYGEPGDWNMWRRMKEAGVKIGFIDRVVGKHHLEFTQHQKNKE